MKGQCDYEIEKAIIAKKFLKYVLSHASTIVLVNPGRDKYDRVLAKVLVDGNDLSQLIIDSGNGRRWKWPSMERTAGKLVRLSYNENCVVR